MNIIKDYIEKNGFESLEKDLGIDVRQFDNLYSLNYSQIDSPKYHPVADLCRALVIDQDYNIISRSFDRFYNLGENDTKLDLKNSTIFEKADGSIISFFYNPYKDKWEIKTRKSFYAELRTGKRYKAAILETLDLSEERFQKIANIIFNKEYTYIFEYVGPENRHVTRYLKNELILIGVRHNQLGIYCDLDYVYNDLRRFLKNVRLPIVYNFNSEEDLFLQLENLPDFGEGFVALNKLTGERIKIKSKLFLQVFYLRNNGVFSEDKIIELIISNDHNEYLAYYPEDYYRFDQWIKKIEIIKNELQVVWDNVKNIPDKKEFALEVKQLATSSILFFAKNHEIDISNAWNQVKLNTKVNIIKNF